MRLLLVVLFLLLSISGNCQVAYWDAYSLRSSLIINNDGKVVFDPSKVAMVTSVMEKYDSSFDAEKNNPFLSGYLSSIPTAHLERENKLPISDIGKLSLQTTSSAIAGLNVTTFTDALAKFLVSRTKDELTISFFENFKKEMDNDKFSDVKIIFPNTYQLLENIGDDIYQYQLYLNSLRIAFNTDLYSLPDNLQTILSSSAVAQSLSSDPLLKFSLGSSFYIADGIEHHINAGLLIENFPATYIESLEATNNPSLKNIAGVVQTLQLFSYSLKNKDNSSYWIPSDSLHIMTDTNFLKLYLGLIYEQGKHISFASGTLSEYLSKGFAAGEGFKPYINFLIGFGQQAAYAQDNLFLHPSDDSTRMTLYNRYVQSVTDLFFYMGEISKLPGLQVVLSDTSCSNASRSFITVLEHVQKMASAAKIKDYTVAINNVFYLYGLLAKGNDSLTGADKIILKYGSFMAAVCAAQTSDEIEQEIQTIAMPAGSSRVKRESAFTVSLNGYVGPFMGAEHIGHVDTKFRINSYGVSAPVGITVSKGLSFHSSLSVFFSIVDIGAVTAFRFSNDTVSQVADIQLKDIIAPGIFLMYDIPRTPLSFSIGAQSGPRLRDVSTTYNETIGDTYVRYFASLYVDIPLINIYVKPKKL